MCSKISPRCWTARRRQTTSATSVSHQFAEHFLMRYLTALSLRRSQFGIYSLTRGHRKQRLCQFLLISLWQGLNFADRLFESFVHVDLRGRNLPSPEGRWIAIT